jgi:hypothetical protein
MQVEPEALWQILVANGGLFRAVGQGVVADHADNQLLSLAR